MQAGSIFRGTFDFASEPFDWGKGYRRPGHAPQDLIIYEMSVRSFTADDSSGVGTGRQGTFLGLADKVCWTFFQSMDGMLEAGSSVQMLDMPSASHIQALCRCTFLQGALTT